MWKIFRAFHYRSSSFTGLLVLALGVMFLGQFEFTSTAQLDVDQRVQDMASTLDENQNRVLDDTEILNAIQLWILGEALPDGETITDDSILSLIQLWITGESISKGIIADDGVPTASDPDACFTETADFTIPTKEPGTLLRHWISNVKLPENCDEDCQRIYSDPRRELTDIEVDSKGNIFATDRKQNAIVKYDPQGNFLAEWRSAAQNQNLEGLFIDASDHIHAVSSGFVMSMNTITEKWDTEGKAFPNRTISIVPNPRWGENWFLNDIVVDSDGVQYISIIWLSAFTFVCPHCHNHDVQQYDQQGNLIKDLHLNGGKGVALDDRDTFYTASDHSVEQGEAANRDDKHIDGFSLIRDIAIDGRNHLYVLDYGNDGHTVEQYDPSGSNLLAEWTVKGSKKPTDIAVDDEGHVYVLMDESRIEKYCAGGF